MPRVRHKVLEFKLFKYYISQENKTKQKRQLLLDERNGNKVSSCPIVESTVGSREDPIVQVAVIISVFYNVNSMVSDV